MSEPGMSNSAKAKAFAERMGQLPTDDEKSVASSGGGSNKEKGSEQGEEEEIPEGMTKAAWAAQKRREARETARVTRLSKRPVKPEDVAVEKRTRGEFAENNCGGFPPFFGMASADRFYVEHVTGV